jgi:hypothetical protein
MDRAWSREALGQEVWTVCRQFKSELVSEEEDAAGVLRFFHLILPNK